jgi:hypothetical protein
MIGALKSHSESTKSDDADDAFPDLAAVVLAVDVKSNGATVLEESSTKLTADELFKESNV